MRASAADRELPAAVCAQGIVSNMLEENVVQPLLVTVSALNLATECVRMILKVTPRLPAIVMRDGKNCRLSFMCLMRAVQVTQMQ